MDIRDFIKKQDNALKKYRRIYKLLDFSIIALILYTILLLFSVDQLLPLINAFEVRVGTSYDIAGLSINFETAIIAIVSAFFAFILTLMIHIRDKKTSAILLVEDKYPHLREKLRTAYDNLDVDSIIVSDLEEKVLINVSKIDKTALLSMKLLIIGIVGLMLSSATVTYVTVYEVHILEISTDDWKDLTENLPFAPDGGESDEFIEVGDSSDEEGDGSDSEDLIGEPAVIVVEGKEVDLTLPPGSGVGFSNAEDAEETEEDFQQSSAYEISIISSQAYDEELPDGYELIIKDYFEELAKK